MKTNLIIDGNWLLMSRFFSNHDEFLKELPEDMLEDAKDNLKDFLAQSIVGQINKMENLVDNIVLVCDGGSWRNKIEKPEFLKDEEYKGTRVREETIAWDYVFKALEELKMNFDELGITATKEYGIEGDDWIWYWTKKLNTFGENCIIWSTDGDLKQLICKNQNGTWTVHFNEQYGLTLPEEFNNEDIDNFLMNMGNSDPILEVLSSLSQKPTKYINPDDIVMEKIMCGDSGDNVKAILRVESKGRTYKYTPKMWGELKESLEIHSLEDFFAKVDDIVNSLVNNPPKKFATVERDFSKLNEHLRYNERLVFLNYLEYPQEVLDKMYKYNAKYPGLDYIRDNFKALSGNKDDSIEDIFEGVEVNNDSEMPF